MTNRLSKSQFWTKQKARSLTLGAVVGTGAMIFGQSCAATGQCASCGGACVSRLPLLAVPILVDGAIVMAKKIKNKEGSELTSSQEI
jgi:hypothetical protein